MLTHSQKKYLFAIYKLGQNGRPVKSADVAKIVGVSKASTVKMTQRLTEEVYIVIEPYMEISITQKGIKAANELYTPSVILCDFLAESVGVDESTADADAVAMVSHLSEGTVEKLVKFALEHKKI
mgnify:FL=1